MSRDLDQIISDAVEEFLDYLKEDPTARYPEDRMHEIADGAVPIHYGDILQCAVDDINLALSEPEVGPAFDGSPTPIKQLASVGAPEPTQIVIRPYDPTTIKEIEKAIIGSDLGFNPQNDGRVIRINVPALSTEVRRKMVSRIKELAEEAKVSIRSIRRDANKAAEQAQKDKTLTDAIAELDDRLGENRERLSVMRQKFELLSDDLAPVHSGSPWASGPVPITDEDVEVAFLREKQRRNGS